MEMTFTSVCRLPSALSQTGFLFTLIYGIWCLIVLVRRKSARPSFLAIIPFLVIVPIVWSSYVNVMEGMALSGGGRASTAAGFADALMMLEMGALTSALLALVASIRGPRGGNTRSSAAAILVHATLAGLTLWFARAVSNGALDLLLHQLRPVVILFAAALVAFSAALLMRRLHASPIAIAVVMAIIVFVTHAQIRRFAAIAMGL